MTLDLREHPELLDWIGTGQAFVFGPDLGREFRSRLEELPREPDGRIRWAAFPGSEEIDPARMDDEARLRWANRMAFGRHGLVLVELGRRQAPVAVPFDLAVRALWRVLAHAVGPVYACGASTAHDGELAADWSALVVFEAGRIRAVAARNNVH